MTQQLKSIESADMVHVDVMDSHFVPNLTFGLPVVNNWRKVSPIAFDVHLMIEDPDTWVVRYAENSEMVTFHIESAKDPERIIKKVKELGKQVGIALKPNTPMEPYLSLIVELDQLLVMTVEPGFGGQKFMLEMLPKIRLAREAIDAENPACFLQVDGGINKNTIKTAAEAGADTFVAGSAVFDDVDPSNAIANLRKSLSG